MNLQSANFSVNWMAKKLHVTRSGFYAWLHRQENPGPRAKEEETIAKLLTLSLPSIKSFMVHCGFIRSYGVKALESAANGWRE
jgi:hypothetical protein